MSATRCPTPKACGAASHHAGTAAARACATRTSSRSAAPPPPPAPDPLDRRSGRERFIDDEHAAAVAPYAHLRWPTARQGPLREQQWRTLQEGLAADDPPGWTPGCGRAHPSGGYTERTVTAVPGYPGALEIRHNVSGTAAGLVWNHRTDGPAVVNLDGQGKLIRAMWRQDGEAHRVDGPCILLRHEDDSWEFALRGSYAVDDHDDHDDIYETDQDRDTGGAMTRYLEHLEAGCTKEQAVAWLMVATELGGDDLVTRLRDAGGDALACQRAVGAGAREPAALLAVATSRAPASWASPAR